MIGSDKLHERFDIPYGAIREKYELDPITHLHAIYIKEDMCKGVDKEAVRDYVPLTIKVIWE